MFNVAEKTATDKGKMSYNVAIEESGIPLALILSHKGRGQEKEKK